MEFQAAVPGWVPNGTPPSWLGLLHQWEQNSVSIRPELPYVPVHKRVHFNHSTHRGNINIKQTLICNHLIFILGEGKSLQYTRERSFAQLWLKSNPRTFLHIEPFPHSGMSPSSNPSLFLYEFTHLHYLFLMTGSCSALPHLSMHLSLLVNHHDYFAAWNANPPSAKDMQPRKHVSSYSLHALWAQRRLISCTNSWLLYEIFFSCNGTITISQSMCFLFACLSDPPSSALQRQRGVGLPGKQWDIESNHQVGKANNRIWSHNQG